MIEIDGAARITAGVVMLTIVGIESGGGFVFRVVTGKVAATDFQKAFFRAGHAHAGVLVTLGLVCLLLTQATDLAGAWRWLAATGVLWGAVLLPGGFFFSAMGPGRTSPNRWKVLFPLGGAMIAAGTVTLAVGLLA
ncbi:hypothetical protein [Xylanimonas protaetiae]|uniref:DUF423 domain-containing protein n=1 Tax=Xylanimonas protaetiae TaxID=2509457 RepID=A0A4V0YGB1_9MICO|nr:hypothetical protein [Xylanimonas protaetiae]QAY70591.1 hypothetical protein ET471_11600 [Xylanimonas protaetiae]